MSAEAHGRSVIRRSGAGKAALSGRAVRYWSAAWVGLAGVGIANGAARRLYARPLGELRAHQLSGLTFAALYLPYALLVGRRRPLRTLRGALLVGVGWAAGAAAFDALVGHYVGGASWQDVLEAYDVRRGRVWGGVVLLITAGPALSRAVGSVGRPHARLR